MSRSTVARPEVATHATTASPATPSTSTRPQMTEQDLDAQSPAADLVRVYLNGIGRTALLNAEQEVELAKQIEAGLYARHLLDSGKRMTAAKKRDLALIVREGEIARSHLLEANLRLVVSLAKRYTGRGMPLLDLIQEGNLGLIRAMEKFDYTKGFKFSTYATWWVRQSISRGIAQQGRIVRLPVHVAEQVNQVSAVRRTLERRFGREPELVEIADAELCCGSAGSYNLDQPEIAASLGARKAAAVLASGASVVVSGNIGCLTQIAGGTGVPVVHTVELLDWASGGPEPAALRGG